MPRGCGVALEVGPILKEKRSERAFGGKEPVAKDLVFGFVLEVLADHPGAERSATARGSLLVAVRQLSKLRLPGVATDGTARDIDGEEGFEHLAAPHLSLELAPHGGDVSTHPA